MNIHVNKLQITNTEHQWNIYYIFASLLVRLPITTPSRILLGVVVTWGTSTCAMYSGSRMATLISIFLMSVVVARRTLCARVSGMFISGKHLGPIF